MQKTKNRFLKAPHRIAISAAAGALLLSACGSGASAAQGQSSKAPTAGSGTTNSSYATIRAMLPSSIKSKGAITVGSEVDYPPMEMFAANGTTPEGADYDLGQAVGKILGVKVKFVNNAFAGLIPGLAGGRFDMIMSAMTDNRKREKVVNFADYFAVGSGMLVQAGNPHNIHGLLDLCGKTTVLPQATIQVNIAQQEQAKCKAAGRPPIVIKQVPTPSDTYVQLESGASVASMIDYPVAVYTAKKSHGKLIVLPQQIGQVLPYGIAFRKNEPQLEHAVLASVKLLMKNGTYAQILKRWGVTKGAITPAQVVVNGARS